MKVRYFVLIILGVTTALAGHSSSPAQSGLESTTHGVVDSVRAVLVETLQRGHGDTFEHAVGPSDQLVVRLEDGREFTVLQNSLERFGPGERVMLSRSKYGTRVEHAPL